jgi:hypothetical protein
MAGVKGMKWGHRKPRYMKRDRSPTIKQRLTAAGMSERLYAIWNAMNYRCHNPKSANYPGYGGRGCSRWRRGTPNAFWNFVEDVGNPPADKSLDRRNNDAGYSPDNTRWADQFDQHRNRREGVNTLAWRERARAQKILDSTTSV